MKTFLSAMAALAFVSQAPLAKAGFVQTNLVSNISGLANNLDPNLKDPWGMSFSGSSPIWVSDRAAGVSTLYSGTGALNSLVVTVPPGAPLGPTGQVFAGGTNFKLNNSAVSFIFDTLGGNIDAWNVGTTATVMTNTPGANFTGLALANNTLFAANFQTGGGVNVFDSTFTATTTSGGFVDLNLPTGYAPFNVQNINGNIYVEFAKVTSGVPVALPGGGGFVDVFDTNGNLLHRLAGGGPGGPIDAPWGVALAPAGFGSFGGDVLVGNFSDGRINAFDPTTGIFQGFLADPNGNAIANPGLWAIAFGNSSANPNALYFNVGLNGGNDGLFGDITSVPEPISSSLVGLGVLALAGYSRRKSLRG
jgi:uncharacterized protein (TIGR03118 family)